MIVLRSILFNLVFYLTGAVFLTAALPTIICPRRVVTRTGEIWLRFTLGALKVICGITHEIRGRENLPSAPCIVAAKHQSAWDTVVFNTIVDDGAYVIKQELTRIPVYGWMLARAEMVPVDRTAGAKALRRMLKTAEARLAAGRSIVIFPEGTRTSPGEHRAYHPGVAALYDRLGVQVVPVALNSGLFWPRRAFNKRPGHIIVEILPPIPPGLARRDFMNRLETAIEETTARLCARPRD